jgi:hypothetical protein
MKQLDDALGLVHAWTKRIGLIALAIIALMMVLKAIGVPIAWRTPALDQSTGIALAALAYVLHR